MAIGLSQFEQQSIRSTFESLPQSNPLRQLGLSGFTAEVGQQRAAFPGITTDVALGRLVQQQPTVASSPITTASTRFTYTPPTSLLPNIPSQVSPIRTTDQLRGNLRQTDAELQQRQATNETDINRRLDDQLTQFGKDIKVIQDKPFTLTPEEQAFQTRLNTLQANLEAQFPQQVASIQGQFDVARQEQAEAGRRRAGATTAALARTGALAATPEISAGITGDVEKKNLEAMNLLLVQEQQALAAARAAKDAKDFELLNKQMELAREARKEFNTRQQKALENLLAVSQEVRSQRGERREELGFIAEQEKVKKEASREEIKFNFDVEDREKKEASEDINILIKSGFAADQLSTEDFIKIGKSFNLTPDRAKGFYNNLFKADQAAKSIDYKTEIANDGTILLIPNKLDPTKPIKDQVLQYGEKGQFGKKEEPKTIGSDKLGYYQYNKETGKYDQVISGLGGGNDVLSPTELANLGIPSSKYGITQKEAQQMIQSGQIDQALTPQQQTIFNSIVDKYQKSPLIQASDRTIVLENTINQIKENPSDAAQQLNLIYSYIQALDTYQSAVREGELTLSQNIESTFDKYKTNIERVKEGKIIGDKAALQIADAAKLLVDNIKQGAASKEKAFQSQAKTSSEAVGNAWDNYIAGFKPSYGDTTPKTPEDELQKNAISDEEVDKLYEIFKGEKTKDEIRQQAGFNGDLSMSEKGLSSLGKSIVAQESGGNYGSVGDVPVGYKESDRALGKYQIIPKFHFSKIGLSNTSNDRQKFLNSPKLQDKLFNIIIADLAKQYNNDPKKIAAAYYGGAKGANIVGTPAGDKPQIAGGKKYPSINEYVGSVLSRIS